MALACGILVCIPARRANADLSLTLANSSPTFSIPTSGSTEVTITGTLTMTGQDIPAAIFISNDAFQITPPTLLGATIDPALSTFVMGPTGGTYTGPILDIVLTPTTRLGTYADGHVQVARLC
jgi:hypothetical protein